MSKEIKLYLFTESLYDAVGDKIIEFCDKTYYGSIIFSFEQSYDGIEWTKEIEFASFENCTDLYYETDWNEGQKYIRNLRIWHLEDSEPTKHGRWLRTDAYPHRIYCSECYATFIRNDEFLHLEDIPHNYCPECGTRMDEPAPEAAEIINDGTYSAGEEDRDGIQKPD